MAPQNPIFSICLLDKRSPVIIEALVAVFAALKKSLVTQYEIIIVSASAEISMSLDEVVARYPEVKVIVLPAGIHRIDMLNYAVRKTSGEVLCLLNANVIVDSDFFLKLYEYREKVNWLAVVPRVRMAENTDLLSQARAIPSKSRFSIDDLMVEFRYGTSQPASVVSAPAGVSCWKRDSLLKLNGFSSAYKIFNFSFFSDTETTYRGWRNGYGSVYEPGLTVCLISIEGISSFYSLWPELVPEDDFIYKVFWNIAFSLFMLRNRFSISLKKSIIDSLVRLDFLSILTRFIASVVFLFVREKFFDLGSVYSFEKIKQMTDRDEMG